LGLDLEQAAWGIHSVANANMERAMRIVSIERGRDPRRYALVAFGGAGPLHACRLARALEIPRVIVPRGAGVGSALGLMVAEQKLDLGLTRVVRLEGASLASVQAVFAELEARVLAEAARMQSGARVRLQRSASMHHVGQGYEIRVDLPDGPIDDGYEASVIAAFRAAYKREYGYNDPHAGIEVTDWYVVATILDSRVEGELRLEAGRGGDPVTGERLAYFPEAGGMVASKVIDRYRLTEAHRFAGPAMVEERESTTVVPPGDMISLSPSGNLIIALGGAS